MNKYMEKETLEQYKKRVEEKLKALTPIFANAALGDFSTYLEIPDQEDEFAQLYVGVRIMLDVVNDQIRNLEQRVAEKTETIRKTLVDIDKFKKIIQESSESICVADGSQNHLFVYVNRAWEIMTGWTSEEVVGKLSPRILKSGKQDAQFYKNLWDTIGAQKIFRAELVNKRKNGSFYDAEIIIFPVTDSSGVRYYAELARDITDRKLLDQHLQDHARELEKIIRENTATLQDKIKMLERTNKVMVGRELAMVELKKEMKALQQELQQLKTSSRP